MLRSNVTDILRESNKRLHFPGKKNPDDEDTERKDKKGNEREDMKGVKYGFCFFKENKMKYCIHMKYRLPVHARPPPGASLGNERKKEK